MLSWVLRTGGLAAAALPAAGGAAAVLLSPNKLMRQVHGGARCERVTQDEPLSSRQAASHSSPDNPIESTDNFNQVADLYLGGLWSKMREQVPGEAGVELEHDSMKLSLPDGGRITITKDPESRSLVVHSNLHDTFSSDGSDNEVPFRLQRDHTWEMDGEELHQFLEDGLAKHLKVQVDLEPEAQTIYGPDPT